jgi:hypothetical protein
MTTEDYTLKDTGRRNFTVSNYHRVKEVLPQHIVQNYPLLVGLLESYFEFEDLEKFTFTDSDGTHTIPASPTRLIHEVLKVRDINETDETLLNNIEDELLLGTQYFRGFIDKRTSAKFSNNLYRAKGTLYSIQQFFKMFFDEVPEVRYTKQDVFIVGESKIGWESQKFLTNDKLYQTLAILIKTSIPINVWNEVYKLFVHPAGVYLGARVLIEGVGDFDLNFMPDYKEDEQLTLMKSQGNINTDAIPDLTYLIKDDNPELKVRTTIPGDINTLGDITLDQLDKTYNNLKEFIQASSPTLDNDFTDSDLKAMTLDQDWITLDTMDEVSYPVFYDSDENG